MVSETFPPASRRTDPRTSHDSEAEHTAGGRRATHCRLIFQSIRLEPGRTCREIAKGLPLDAYEVSKRLSDLHQAGKIVSVGERRCLLSGRKARVWIAREADPVQLHLL